MTRTGFIAVLFLASPVPAQDAAVLLEKGIYAEETLGDLDRAIEAYQKIVAEHAAQRASAAEAEFRLAMCRKKKGDVAQAVSGLEKVLALYPDRQELGELARRELAKLKPARRGLPTGKEERRKVLDEEGKTDCYLDLDTGSIFDLEAGRSNRTEGFVGWLRSAGGDVAGNSSLAGFNGFDMAVRQVDPSAWESDPEQLRKSMEGASTLPRVGLHRYGGRPVSYLFKTREGSIGLLEIVWVTAGKPGNIQVRFRLLSQGLPDTGASPLERAGRLLPQIKSSFFQAVLAVKNRDAAAARKSLATVMPLVRDLEKSIQGTPAAETIGLAIRQLERFDEAVRAGDLDRAAGIFEALDVVGPALEKLIGKLGGSGAARGKVPRSRLAFRLVAVDEDRGPSDELVDPSDSSGQSPRVRVLQEVIADGKAVASAAVRQAAAGTGWEISLSLSEEGAKTLSEASAKFLGRRLAIVVDGKLVSAPTIRDRIGKEVVISGRFTHGEAALLARALAPVPEVPEEVEER